MSRVYLDWNATTPLRDEARGAMMSAMDVLGNPSSVHSEGRAAKGLIEQARKDLEVCLGAEGADIIFTSSATEAAALALTGQDARCSGVEHDAVRSWCVEDLPVDSNGLISTDAPGISAIQLANSETGVIQKLPEGLLLTDATQAFGKIPFAFNWCGAQMAMVSAHKLGGPKGIGALVVKRGTDLAAQIKGGGQEMGRRSGTENVIGIAGFAAAAKAAQREIEGGSCERIAKLRKILEKTIAESEKSTIFVGNDANRLPNTSCFIAPGWKGATQVMVMDLAGFAISAGSACSSGKVKSSAALRAMGFSETEAACAIRVSIGASTCEEEILAFADAWGREYAKFRARNG